MSHARSRKAALRGDGAPAAAGAADGDEPSKPLLSLLTTPRDPIRAALAFTKAVVTALWDGCRVMYSWRYWPMMAVRYKEVFDFFDQVHRREFTTITLGQQVGLAAERFGDKVALRCGENALTFTQLHARSDHYAEFMMGNIGLGKCGTCERVALMLPNSLDLITLVIAGAKVGGCAALINTNLGLESLARSIQLGVDRAAPVLFYGHDYQEPVVAMLEQRLLETVSEFALAPQECAALRLLVCRPHGDPSPHGDLLPMGAECFHTALACFQRAPGGFMSPLDDSLDTAAEAVMHIFTSGTTGMPKASKVPHLRFLYTGATFCKLFKVHGGDVIYCPLPFYHSNATVCSFGMTLHCGATLVMREGKFSASAFFPDCKRYGATCAMYIGEVGRFLARLPPPLDPVSDQAHGVRLLFGNGLRPEVWRVLQQRYAIPQIGEFYGATEAPSALFNVPGLFGGCAFNPWPVCKAGPFRIVRIDPDTGDPVRHPKTGFVVECNWREPGELLSKLGKEKHNTFHGYTDGKSTSKKVAYDCFAAGDAWFRTGDLMRHNSDGLVTFVDRIGDTFRWKGENVATTEVQLVCSAVVGIAAVDVYGVQVPEADGRCGMAAIQLSGAATAQETLRNLYTRVSAQLPRYARPIFVRLVTEVQMTGTLKVSKRTLQEHGYDPQTVSDVFWYPGEGDTYVALTISDHTRITTGLVKL